MVICSFYGIFTLMSTWSIDWMGSAALPPEFGQQGPEPSSATAGQHDRPMSDLGMALDVCLQSPPKWLKLL